MLINHLPHFNGLHLFSCSVVFTTVEQVEYSVQENQNSVEVCAEVSGRTQIPVSVILASLERSATSKPFACMRKINNVTPGLLLQLLL